MIPSPWIWETTDENDKAIKLVFNWDTSNYELMSVITYRDPECQYDQIFVVSEGLSRLWDIPEEESILRFDFLSSTNLTSIHEVVNSEIMLAVE